MTDQSFELRLVEDNLHSGAAFVLPADGINRVVYVAHGSVDAASGTFSADSAWLSKGGETITAGSEGAALWRWELAPAGSRTAEVEAGRGATRQKLVAPLAWPIADRVLMRADSVAFPPGGCAYTHTHQGPGIRCLIEGGVRIDTDGHSTAYAPGGAWFEAGPIPVFAQAASDKQSRFIRVMVLPASLLGKSSISYVKAEDLDKPKSQSYKGYVDTVIG